MVQFKLTTEGAVMNWSVKSPGAGLIYSISKNTIYTINLQYLKDSDEKGLIWVNGANNELKVNLSQKYEWKLDVAMVHGVEAKLIYAIDNA